MNNHGIVDIAALEAHLHANPHIRLVSVMLANNETGVIQPIADIAAIVHRHNAYLHVDAVQAIGKIPVDMGLLGADMLTLSAHKCGGPLGAAALVVRDGVPFAPLLKGGRQEEGRRAGTENVAAIAGFALAMQLAQDGTPMQELRGWLNTMEAELCAYAPESRIWGKAGPRLPSTSCLSMPGVENEVQLMHMDLNGIMVSAGSACSSGRIEPSHVLLAMGASAEEARCALRVSGGWNTCERDILRFTEAWKQLYKRLKHKEK